MTLSHPSHAQVMIQSFAQTVAEKNIPASEVVEFARRYIDAMPGLMKSPPPADAGSAEGWQEIETAPKDGTLLWTLWDGVNRRTGEPARYYHAAAYDNEAEYADTWVDDHGELLDDPPTHWRPMPPPPGTAVRPADAVTSPAGSAEWQTVPKVADAAMLDAARAHLVRNAGGAFADIWVVMCAAAPPPPVGREADPITTVHSKDAGGKT